MDVLSTNAWSDGNIEVPKNSFYFGLRDLTSDYYQVMIERERPRWCRALWFVIIVILLIFTGYVVYLMVADYISFGSYDRIETITNTSSVLLPSITICSLNTLNYTAMTEALAATQGEVMEQYKALALKAYWYEDFDTKLDDASYSTLVEYEKANGPLSYVYRNSAKDLFANYHSKYDFKINGLGKNITNWLEETGVNELGECIELNDDSSMKQTIGGAYYGVTLDLDAGLADYSPFTTSTGFRVFIKDHDETMFFNEGGTVVAAGSETFLRVRLNQMERQGNPWGTCVDKLSSVSKYNTTNESRKECFQMGKAVAMFQFCNCIPWYIVHRLSYLGKTSLLDKMLKNQDDNVERKKRSSWDKDGVNYTETYGDDAAKWMDEYDDFDEYFATGLNYSDSFCSSVQEAQCAISFPALWGESSAAYTYMCSDGCEYNAYEVALTSSSYPASEGYFNYFIKSDDNDITWEYAQKNLVRLHIFYSDIEYHTITQTKDYEIQNFIGELGGVVDLFIGFSFFTVFQLLEISVAYIIMRMCRKRKPDEEQPRSMGSNKV